MSDDDAALRRFDQLAARAYAERRLTPGTRDLVLALGWAALRDPRRHRPGTSVWERARDALNTSNTGVWQAIADDVPRYEYHWHSAPRGCQAPMVRVDRLCGRTTSLDFAEFDPVTGWMTSWGVCSRCRAAMRPVHDRARGSRDRAPEPIPNTGGLLPLFFTWDWERRYCRAEELIRYRPDWEPPPYGLSADAWPAVPGTTAAQAFPKLRLVASDGEFVGSDQAVPAMP
ncbi:hypothetical protein OG216_46815 (plasmid) [Streptomycetaceae bacterium NBC_01309]